MSGSPEPGPLLGLATVIHDLRQPLHALALNTQALRQRLAGPRAQAEPWPAAELLPLADQIAAAAALLEAQFDELLDQTRALHAAVPVRPEPLAIGELFERLRLQLGPLAFDRGLSLRCRGAQHRVHADARLLARLLGNLLANALQHTDDGGVLLACRRRAVAGGIGWRLQVWDSGRGIDPADQARVFEPFERAGPARPSGRPVARGHGLGLAICRRLAAAMGAELSLCSRPGRGTVVTLAWTEPVASTPPHTMATPRTG